MNKSVDIRCHCGQFTGTVSLSPPGQHVVCYCQDCQAFARWLDPSGGLQDDHGGAQIFQVTPSQIQVKTGHDQMTCVRLSEEGMVRWYTSCCQTPITNMMANAKFAFAGMPVAVFGESLSQLGPVQYRLNAGDIDAPGAHTAVPFGMLMKTLVRILGSTLRGRARPSEFVDDDGRPVVAPKTLSHDEREAIGLPPSN